MTRASRARRLVEQRERAVEEEVEQVLSRRLVESVFARYLMGCLHAYHLWVKDQRPGPG